MTRQSDLGRKLDGILAFQYIYILFTLAQVLVNMFLVRNIFIKVIVDITENNDFNTVDTNGWQDDYKTLIWILQRLTVDSIDKKNYIKYYFFITLKLSTVVHPKIPSNVD